MWKNTLITSLACFTLGFETLAFSVCVAEANTDNGTVNYYANSDFSSCAKLELIGKVNCDSATCEAERARMIFNIGSGAWTYSGNVEVTDDSGVEDEGTGGVIYVTPTNQDTECSLEIFGGVNISPTNVRLYVYGAEQEGVIATGKLILSGASTSLTSSSKDGFSIGSHDSLAGFVSIGNDSAPFGDAFVYLQGEGSRLLVTDTLSIPGRMEFDSYSPTLSIYLDVDAGKTLTFEGEVVCFSEDSDEYTRINELGGSGTVVFAKTTTSNVKIDSLQINGGVLEFNVNPSLYDRSSGAVAVGAATLRFGADMIGEGAWSDNHTIELFSVSSFLDDGGNDVTIEALVSDKTEGREGVTKGSGALNKSGRGTITLTNTANSYSLGTYIYEGRLSINTASQLNASTNTGTNGIYLFNGSVLEVTGNTAIGSPVTVDSGCTLSIAEGNTLTLSSSSNLISSGSLSLEGGGTLALSLASTSFTGSFVLIDSILSVLTTASINGNSINLNDSGLEINNNSLTVGSLISSGVSFVNLGSGTLTITNTGINSSNAEVSGTGRIVVTGTDSLNLSGSNSSYSGGTTTSNAVELIIDSGANLGTGSLSLGSGCALGFNPGSTATVTQNISLGGSCTISVPSETTNATISGSLSGSSLLITGRNGFLTLSGANTYTGTTTISQTFVSITSSSSLGNAPNSTIGLTGGGIIATNDVALPNTRGLSIGNGMSELSAAEGKIFTVSGNISNPSGSSGGILVNGPGTTVLGGNNTFGGGIEINGGTLQVSADSNLGASGVSITLNTGTLSILGNINPSTPRGFQGINGTIFVDSGYTGTFAGSLVVTKEDSSLLKTGLGVVEVVPATPAAFFIPFATVAEGTLVSNTYALSGSTITVAEGATLVFAQQVPGTYSGNQLEDAGISGGGTLEVRGASGVAFTLDTVTVPNTYFGPTVLTSGILAISTDRSLGFSPEIIGKGGSLQVTLTTSSLRPVTLEADFPIIVDEAAVFIERGAIFGDIVTNGAVIKQGLGTLVLAPADEFSTYTGGTFLQAGVVKASIDEALGRTSGDISPIVGEGGTLLIGGTVDTSRVVSLTSGTTTTFNIGADLGFDITLTLRGAIEGSGAFIKDGEGKILITSNCTNSGGTTIKAGAIAFDSSNGYIGGDIWVEALSTLEIFDSDNLTPNSSSNGAALFFNGGTLSALGVDPMVIDAPLEFNIGGGVIYVAEARSLEAKGILSENGFTLKGGGTFILSGTSNTYSGSTDILEGTLQIASDNNLGDTSAIILRGGEEAALKVTASITIPRRIEEVNGTIDTDANNVSFTGPFFPSTLATLVKKGTGTLTLSPSSVSLSLPALVIEGGGGSVIGNTTLLSATDITLSASDNTIIFNQASNGTYVGSVSANISGNGNVDVNCASDTVTLTFAPLFTDGNGYYGSTTLTKGILSVAKANDFGVVSSTAKGLIGSGGTLKATASFSYDKVVTLTQGTNTKFSPDLLATLTLSKVISDSTTGSGGGALTKVGLGTLILSNTGNTYTGGTTITEGTLQISAAVLGTGSILFNGGTLYDSAATFSLNNNISVDSGFSALFFVGDTSTSQTLTLNGDISGLGGVTKQGTAILALGGDNTFIGQMTIETGKVSIIAGSINSPVAVQSGATFFLATASGLGVDTSFSFTGGTFESTVNATTGADVSLGVGGAIFKLSSGTTLTLSGEISGSSGFSMTDAGTLVLSGLNTYTGSADVQNGKLKVSSSSNLGSGAINLNGTAAILQVSASTTITQTLDTLNGTIQVDGVDAVTFNGRMNPASDSILKKTGLGTITLAPSNVALTSLSILDIKEGIVISNTSFVSATGISIASGATMVFNQAVSGTYKGNINNSIYGNGSVNIDGLADTTLTFNPETGRNTYTGSTTLTSGTLSTSSDLFLGTALNSVYGDIIGSGGTLETTATFTSSRLVKLTSAKNTIFTQNNGTTLTLTGVISGEGSLTKAGAGILKPTGANTFTGGTTLTGGTLQIAAATLGTGDIIGDGGTLSDPLNTFTLDNDFILNLDKVLTVYVGDTSSVVLTLSGDISGQGGLTKTGLGTLILTGDNTSTGPLTVQTSTLSIIGGSINSAVAVQSGATFSLSTSSGIGPDASFSFTGGTFASTVNATASANISLDLGGAFFTVSSGTTLNLTGAVSGIGGFSMTAPGTLVLSGANTYTGNVELLAGILQVSSEGNLGSSADSIINLNGGTLQVTGTATIDQEIDTLQGTLQIDGTNIVTFTGKISPASGSTFKKTGPGTAIFNPSNVGGISLPSLQIVEGTLIGNTSLLGSTAIAISSGATMTFNQGIAGTYKGTSNGSISGDGSVNIEGASGVILTFSPIVSNTYKGSTTLTSGTLSISNDAFLGNVEAELIGSGGTLQTTATVTSGRSILLTSGASTTFTPNNGTTLTLSGVISGDGSFIKSGPGTLSITSKDNTYTGGTTLLEGVLMVAAEESLGSSGDITGSGGTLKTNDSFTMSRLLSLTEDTDTVLDTGSFTLTYTGNIVGDGSLSKVGTGTLLLQGSNTYLGGTTITAGVVSTAFSDKLGSGPITFKGGSLALTDSMSLSLPMVFTKQGILTISSGETVTTTGAFSGSGGFTVSGGTLILAGANTYTGAAEITSGTLEVSASNSLGDSESSLIMNGSAVTLRVTSGSDVTFSQALEIKQSSTMEVVNAVKASFTGDLSPSTGITLTKTGLGTLAILPSTLSVRSIANLKVNVGNFIGNTSGLSSSIITLASGTSLTFAQSSSGTYSGSSSSGISGAGSVIIAGSSGVPVIFQVQNTFTGGLTLTSGILSISKDNQLGGTTLAIGGNGGTLETTAALTISRGLILSSSTNTALAPSGQNLTWSGVISGDGGLVKDGTGDLTLSVTNSYKGGTTLQGSGALKVSADGQLGNVSGAITGNGGTLLATSTFISSRSLIVNRGSSATFSVDSGKIFTFDGVISDSSGSSGPGKFYKKGAGTLVLGSSSSTSTGSVTISAGDISINLADQLPGSSLVFDGGTLTVTDTMTLAKSMSFSSTGSFKVSSGKILTLSGALSGLNGFSMNGGTITFPSDAVNTYQGNTELVSGTLEFFTDANLGNTEVTDTEAVGSIVLSGGLLNIKGSMSSVRGFQQKGSGTVDVFGNTVTLSGKISSSAGTTLTKQGSGTFALLPTASGSSSLVKVTIKGGKFVGNSASLSSAAVTIDASTELVFEQTSAGTFSGSTANSEGALRMTGTPSGVLTVNGKQEFSGGLYVEGGVYSVSNDNSLGIVADDRKGIVAGKIYGVGTSTSFGTLLATNTFTSDRDVSFTGATLAFEVATGKTWTFDYTDSSPTLITGDTLILGNTANTNAGTLKLYGTVTVATLQINQGALYINGVLQSSTSSASSSFSAFSRESDAQVQVAASDLTGVVVEPGGFLFGSGSIGLPVTVYGGICGGSGADEAVLTITEDVTMESNSLFAVRMDSTTCSGLHIEKTLAINSGASVLLVPTRGLYTAPETLILVEAAGGVAGQFARASAPPVFFMAVQLDYNNPLDITATVTPIEIFPEVHGANADAVANALDKVINWNRENVVLDIPLVDTVSNALLPDVLTSLLPLVDFPNKITNALNQMHPAPLKGMVIAGENASIEVREAISYRLQNELDAKACYVQEGSDCVKSDRLLHFWISGMGNVLTQNSNTYNHSPQVGYQSKLVGFTSGADVHFANYFYAGLAGGYTSSHVEWKQNHGHGDVNIGHGGLYLSFLGEMFYGNLSVLGGWSGYSTTRHINYPGVHETGKSSHGGRELLSHIDTGINLSYGGFTVRPFDSFDYIAGKENSYREKGAGEWNLRIHKSNSILLRNELGLQFAACLCVKNSKWTLSPKASWIREVRVKGSHYKAEFVSASAFPFTVTGYFPSRNLFSPGVMLSGIMLEDKLALNFTYDGEFTGGYSAHRYAAEARFGF